MTDAVNGAGRGLERGFDGGFSSEFATGFATEAMPGSQPFRLDVRFTGSGSEYFRTWLVNLLLILVTLCIYYPWAKVRRLRYFYGNTLVGGESLDFHGKPIRMLMGYVLAVVLFWGYVVLGFVSVLGAFLALLGWVALGPLLFRSAMRFRINNTSWRALRFGFTGTVADAYRALLPSLLPGVAILAGAAVLVVAAVNNAVNEEFMLGFWIFVLLVVLVSPLMVPWLLWRVVGYQRAHLTFAGQSSRFFLKLGGLYIVVLKILGMGVLGWFLVGWLSVAVMDMGILGVVAFEWPWLLSLVALLVFGAWRAYVQAHLQNVFWNHTRTEALQVHSALEVMALTKNSIKNWFLILVTLGLYWPFAAVATARLRLEAVTVFSEIAPDQLMQNAQAQEDAALGEAAGDWFGIDTGL